MHAVSIEKFAFVPERLEIRSGDKVEWVNRDIVPHTASASNRTWSTGDLTKGQSGEISFSAPGTLAYFCNHHPQMRGEIIVVED